MLFHCYLGSILLFSVEIANAIVVDAGVDFPIIKKFEIDSSLSSVSYLNGSTFSQSESLIGSFEVNFLHSWQTYDFDGDISTPDTYVENHFGVGFFHPNISLANGLNAGLQFPVYISYNVEPNLSDSLTDISSCKVPYGLCNHVFDFDQYEIPEFSGLIKNDGIVLDGFQPNVQGGYSYHIEAHVVPVPAAFWLFMSVLGVFAKRTLTKFKVS
jgi:hypothetical protein